MLDALLRQLVLLGDRISVWPVRRQRTANAALLVVRLDAIGDFVLWLDAARHLRSIFPARRITLVANAAWAPLAAALPYWDAVWSVEVRRFADDPIYRWRLLRKVAREGFGIALEPTFSRKLGFGDSVVLASHADQRIGSTGDTSNLQEADRARGRMVYPTAACGP